MNKDRVEGTLRSTVGEAEKTFGRASGDAQVQAAGTTDKIAGSAQSALGSARDAIGNVKDAIGAAASSAAETLGTDSLRDQIARLTDQVSALVSQGVNEAVPQAASAATDRVIALEEDLENRIRRTPLTALAIAVGLGVLLAALTTGSRR